MDKKRGSLPPRRRDTAPSADEDELIVLGEDEPASTTTEEDLIILDEDKSAADETEIELNDEIDPDDQPAEKKRSPASYRSHQPSLKDLTMAAPVVSADEASEEEWSAPSVQSGSHLKIFIWGTLALVAAITAATILVRSDLEERVSTVDASNPGGFAVDESSETLPVITNEDIASAAERIRAMEQLMDDFFAAKSIDDLIRICRHPERMRPLMEDFYADRDVNLEGFEEFEVFIPTTVGSRAFWITQCQLKDGDQRSVLIEDIGGNNFKVDWETFVTYQPHDWDELIRTRPDGEYLVRCHLERNSLNIFKYRDADQWLGFFLTIPDVDAELKCYAQKSSPAGQGLAQLFTDIKPGSRQKMPVVLRLIFPDDARTSDAVEVVELVSRQWAIIEDEDQNTNELR